MMIKPDVTVQRGLQSSLDRKAVPAPEQAMWQDPPLCSSRTPDSCFFLVVLRLLWSREMPALGRLEPPIWPLAAIQAT